MNVCNECGIPRSQQSWSCECGAKGFNGSCPSLDEIAANAAVVRAARTKPSYDKLHFRGTDEPGIRQVGFAPKGSRSYAFLAVG